MKNKKKIHPILKIRQIYSMGYIPSRNNQTYSSLSLNGRTYARQMNCFEHACLNLTNELFDQLQFNEHDYYIFDAKEHAFQPEETVEANFIKKMKDFGLRTRKAHFSSKLKVNEWKVALYFGYTSMLDKDYHFLRQEKDGQWSSKIGWLPEVEYLKKPPRTYYTHGIEYKLYGFYIITNPNYKKENQPIIEGGEDSIE